MSSCARRIVQPSKNKALAHNMYLSQDSSGLHHCFWLLTGNFDKSRLDFTVQWLFSVEHIMEMTPANRVLHLLCGGHLMWPNATLTLKQLGSIRKEPHTLFGLGQAKQYQNIVIYLPNYFLKLAGGSWLVLGRAGQIIIMNPIGWLCVPLVVFDLHGLCIFDLKKKSPREIKMQNNDCMLMPYLLPTWVTKPMYESWTTQADWMWMQMRF